MRKSADLITGLKTGRQRPLPSRGRRVSHSPTGVLHPIADTQGLRHG
jgi:hypothetical protein